ncbi:MAG TPA: KEOPS complex subunit Cgi121 [Nitrososphaerales archaeon]|nr:KEOPS complex subunit Cgi121 [Nitrososphaerales archaeon]
MGVHLTATMCPSTIDPVRAKEEARLGYPGTIVQVLGAGSPTNAKALEMLAAQTLEAAKSGELLANKPEVDFLLRVAGSTQIARALKTSGAVKGSPFILVSFSTSRRPVHLLGTPLTGTDLSDDDFALIEAAALLGVHRT